MRKEKITWIDAVIIIIFMVVVYMILTRIFGHSATDLAILIGLFTLLFTSQYKLFGNQYTINREIGELRMIMKRSFERVKGDMEELREDITFVKNKLK